MSEPQSRFWTKVAVTEPARCWEWQASRREKGYGQFSYMGKPVRAHRLAFYFANGYWPEVVRHTCDNPPCVNPSHLLAGTAKDNARDAIERGNFRPPPTGKGSGNQFARLTEADVTAARAMRAGGSLLREIAAHFGVSRRAIGQAISGETWGHV